MGLIAPHKSEVRSPCSLIDNNIDQSLRFAPLRGELFLIKNLIIEMKVRKEMKKNETTTTRGKQGDKTAPLLSSYIFPLSGRTSFFGKDGTLSYGSLDIMIFFFLSIQTLNLFFDFIQTISLMEP